MKIKKVFALMLASSMVLGLAACGGSGETKGETADTKEEAKEASDDTLTIWAWDEAFNIRAAEDAKELYTKENPDVKIDIVTMARMILWLS